MTDSIYPETSTPMTIYYKDRSATFEMPGWYCDECDESIHTGEDKKVSNRMLDQLKTRQKTNEPFKLPRPLGRHCPLAELCQHGSANRVGDPLTVQG